MQANRENHQAEVQASSAESREAPPSTNLQVGEDPLLEDGEEAGTRWILRMITLTVVFKKYVDTPLPRVLVDKHILMYYWVRK